VVVHHGRLGEVDRHPREGIVTDRCCNRILIDTGYITGPWNAPTYAECEHDWLYDGEVCCLDGGQRWRQTCHCRATRWTDAPNVGPRVDPP
jgi:hypothetical protein